MLLPEYAVANNCGDSVKYGIVGKFQQHFYFLFRLLGLVLGFDEGTDGVPHAPIVGISDDLM